MTAAEFRAARLALGLTWKALAIQLGISWRQVARYESGHSPVNPVTARLMGMWLEAS